MPLAARHWGLHDYCWSFFLSETSNLTQKMLFLIKDLKTKYNLQVQWLWCDNAGESQAFEWMCNQEGLGIHFEYTAPSTPQQNGCIECKFATLFNQVHVMLNGGKFTPYLCSSVWAEAANTAMFLENHLSTPNRSVNPFQQFFGKGKSNILKSMLKFGEMCIATFKDNSHWAYLGWICWKPSCDPDNELWRVRWWRGTWNGSCRK